MCVTQTVESVLVIYETKTRTATDQVEDKILLVLTI